MSTTAPPSSVTNLWQRGLSWCRKASRSKLEAPSLEGPRKLTPVEPQQPSSSSTPADAVMAKPAKPAKELPPGLLVALRVLSSPDELPRILGVVYEREGLRALPHLAPVCTCWCYTIRDVVNRCGGLRLADGAFEGVMGPTYPLSLGPGSLALSDVGPIRTRGETFNGRIRILSAHGVPRRSLGVDYPRGMATDGEHVYVVNSVRDAVHKVRLADGTLLETGPAGGDGRMFGAEGVAYADGSLFVADVGRGRIVAFDTRPQLRWRRQFGGPGAGRGQFNRPTGLAAGGGELFVADTSNHRVQVLQPSDGQCVRCFGAAPPAAGDRAGEFTLPRGVAIDASGARLYVAEQRRVQVLAVQSGMPLQVLAIPGAGTLWGICVTEQHVHVVDNFRQSVLLLELCNLGVAW